MKTNKELLDFYGVELGKKYKITKNGKYPNYYVGRTFVVEERFETKELYLKIDKYYFDIWKLNEFDYEEVESEPLTDEEKDYLRAVIKPFRDRIQRIYKTETSNFCEGGEVLFFIFKNGEHFTLPEMPQGKMFSGMKQDKKYTLEELGL